MDVGEWELYDSGMARMDRIGRSDLKFDRSIGMPNSRRAGPVRGVGLASRPFGVAAKSLP